MRRRVSAVDLWSSLSPSANGGLCLFVMLNPSTADKMKNDPTINRCIAYARAWGFGTLEVVNLFAFRSTDPGQLHEVDDPIGPENDRYILNRATLADCIVAAWGNHGALLGRSDQVRRFLAPKAVQCLGLNKTGEPKHPLYVARDQGLIGLD
ncbi:MAG: DUF1643 domain-containing protein [Nitrososphaera sp.]